MKNLLKILLVSGILLFGVISLNAKEIYLSQQTAKDFTVNVKLYDDLKTGNNEFNVKILYKTKVLEGVDVNFKLYKPNGEVVEYKSNTVNDKFNYVFNINLTDNGEYKYIILYRTMEGGVTRDSRGSFVF